LEIQKKNVLLNVEKNVKFLVALISDEPKTSEELGIFVILENDDEVT